MQAKSEVQVQVQVQVLDLVSTNEEEGFRKTLRLQSVEM
jgi:hypothetical protein